MKIPTALFAIALMPMGPALASDAPGKFECRGTAIVEIDAANNRLDSKTETDFYAVFDIQSDGVHVVEGPLDLDRFFPRNPEAEPGALSYSAKGGGLTFSRETGRFQLTQFDFSDSSAITGNSARIETTSGTCQKFAPRDIFGG